MTQNFGGEYPAYQNTIVHAVEKRYIRRAGNAIGTVGVVMALTAQFWLYAVLFVTGRLGISRESVIRVVTNEGFEQFIQVLFSVFCFFVPFLIAAAVMRVKVSSAVTFERIKKGTFLPYLLLGVSFCAFANLSLGYASNIFEALGFEYNLPESELPAGVVGFLLYTISSAVVPAMAEEFGCRGILMGNLRPMGDGFAILASAVVFGLLHGNFVQIPFAFLVGFILGYIRVKTGSMVICILVHFINNFVSVVLSYLETAASTEVPNICYIVYLCVCLALGIVAVVKISKKEGFELAPADTLTGEKQKLKWFFTSPMIIVFASLEFLYSLIYFFV